MMVNITAILDNGELSLEVNYLPTFTYRFKSGASSNGYGYRLIPVGKYIEFDSAPEIFRDSEGWIHYHEAYSQVVNITNVVEDVIEIFSSFC